MVSISALEFAVAGDVQYKATHNKRRHECRAPVRDKRERKARERDDAKHRANVDECLKDNKKSEAEGYKPTEEIS